MASHDQLYAVDLDGPFYKGTPPADSHDNFHDRATNIGSDYWQTMKFLFFDGGDQLHAVCGDLYAQLDTTCCARMRRIMEGGNLFQSSPPTHGTPADWIENSGPDSWIGFGTEWKELKFLFFGPNGHMYAVRVSEQFGFEFISASPPMYALYDWISNARVIGRGPHWGNFDFLFFGPDGDLYAVDNNGDFRKGSPPTSVDDDWYSRTTQIGSHSWSKSTAFKFLFFGPGGDLYAAACSGELYKGSPPTNTDDNWLARATKIGEGGWQYFQFLFFGP